MTPNTVPRDHLCAVMCPETDVNRVRARARFPSLLASVEPLVAARPTRARGRRESHLPQQRP